MTTSVPSNVYLRHILRARDNGDHFTFSRLYAKVMSKLTALFLQDVINIASMPKTVRAEIKGRDYFLCTAEFLKNSTLGWTRDEQLYHIAALVEKGFVKTTRKGAAGARWLHINFLRIETAIDKHLSCRENPTTDVGKTRQQDVGKTRREERRNEERKRKGGESPAPSPRRGFLFDGNGKIPRHTSAPPAFCYEMEEKIRSIFRRHSMASRRWTRDGGARSIETLWKQLHKNEARLRQFVEGYDRLAPKIERPVPSSIHDLCNLKIFNWLEDQIKAVLAKEKEERDRW